MYRHPTVLAKMASAIDVISNGRLDFGLGAGWYVHETVAYGFEFPSAGQRLDMLEEALIIIRGMFTEDHFRFHGKYYQVGHGRVHDIFHGGEIDIKGAICQPRPVQKHVPFWVGGGGEKKTLKIVARLGDWSNVVAPDVDTLKHKTAILDRHCEDIGRDPAAVRRSTFVEVFFGSAEEAEQRQQRPLPNVICGDNAQPIIDKIAALRDAGPARDGHRLFSGCRRRRLDGALQRRGHASAALI